MAVLEHADEDLLHEVLGRRAVAREAQEEVEKALVMTLEELAQQRDVAVPHPAHELAVAGAAAPAVRSAGSVTAAIP